MLISVLLLIVCTAILAYIAYRLRRAPAADGKRRLLRGVCIAAAAAILLELSVFQLASFISNGFEPITDFSINVGGQVTKDGDVYEVNADAAEAYIEITGIDAHVDNLYLGIAPVLSAHDARLAEIDEDFNENDALFRAIPIEIQAYQTGRSNMMNFPPRTVVDTVARTRYIRFYLAGVTPSIRINIKDYATHAFRIERIALNTPVPYAVSYVRLIAVFLLFACVAVFRPGSPLHAHALDLRAGWQRAALIVCVMAQIAVAIGASFCIPSFDTDEERKNSQYNKLASALLGGYVYLSEQPTKELIAMDDPYDLDARTKGQVYYRWDHAYYNERYYVYFGVLPVITFYVPYQALFDRNLGAPFVHSALSIVLVPGIVLLLYALARKYGKRVRFSTFLLVEMAFVGGCGLFDLAKYARFYSTTILMALVLGVYGLACLLTASRNGRIYKWKLVLGATLLGAILGCRPPMFLVILLALPIFWREITVERTFFSKKGLANTLCVLVPCIVLGCLAMWYNVLRFGNPLDFGATYNLTIANHQHNAIPAGVIPHGLFRFFWQTPELVSEFPFLTDTQAALGVQTLFEQEVMFGGYLWLCPLLFAVPFIYTLRKDARYRQPVVLSAMLIGIALILSIIDMLFAGILMRYLYDFGWLLLIVAAIVLFIYDGDIVQGALSRKWFHGATALAALTSAFIGVLLLFTWGSNGDLAQENATLFYMVKSLVHFLY